MVSTVNYKLGRKGKMFNLGTGYTGCAGYAAGNAFLHL